MTTVFTIANPAHPANWTPAVRMVVELRGPGMMLARDECALLRACEAVIASKARILASWPERPDESYEEDYRWDERG